MLYIFINFFNQTLIYYEKESFGFNNAFSAFPPFFLSFFLSFFLLFLVSCDKGYDKTTTEAGLKETIPETVFSYSAEDNDGLTITAIDFPISVKDGILEFENVEDFTKASVAINNSTDEMIKSWAAGIGFQSEYVEYMDILDRFEAMEDDDTNFSKTFTPDELDKYQFIPDEGAYWVKPRFDGRSTASLLNREGLVVINHALNYFAEDFHILVIDGDKDKLNTAIQNQSAVGLIDVIYTKQNRENIDKTNNKLIPCPSGGVAHKETIGKQRLIVEFFTYVFSVHSSTDLVTFNWTVNGKIHNKRKKGGKWRRTWTDLELKVTRLIEYGIFLQSTPLPTPITIVPVFTDVAGYPTGMVFLAPWTITYVNKADTDELLLSRSDGFFDTSAFDFLEFGFIATGRIQGKRTSGNNSTATAPPRLDITVGCDK